MGEEWRLEEGVEMLRHLDPSMSEKTATRIIALMWINKGGVVEGFKEQMGLWKENKRQRETVEPGR